METYDDLDREFAILELEPRRTASPDDLSITVVGGLHRGSGGSGGHFHHGSGGSGGSGGHFHHGSGGSGGGSGGSGGGSGT